MDETERQKYEDSCAQLRVELKRFEGDWAKEHGGKKPGRDDIKSNPDIGMPQASFVFSSVHFCS